MSGENPLSTTNPREATMHTDHHPPFLDDILAGPFVWAVATTVVSAPARWVLRILGVTA